MQKKINTIFFTLFILLSITVSCYSIDNNSSNDDSHIEAFSYIYDHGIWGKNNEGIASSGGGSTLARTTEYRELLQNFLHEHDIKTVVDAGCGDWEFSAHIDWTGIEYKGYDAVQSVIQTDIERYASDHISFVHGSFLTTDLPPADLLLCKHVLQHLTNEDIITFIPQLSKYKYCLITNEVHPKTLTSHNPNIRIGDCRHVDLAKPPFNLPGHALLNYSPGGFGMHQVFFIDNTKKNVPLHQDQSIPEHFKVEFHEAMSWNPGYETKSEKNKISYQIAQELYNNYIDDIKWHKKPLIPKISHTIWLGSSLPSKQLALFKTWTKHNPNWTHVIWTDHPSNYDLGEIVAHSYQELKELLIHKKHQGMTIVVDMRNITLENQYLYNGANNYGEKSDILRYEVLNTIGGVYRDTDYECLKPFDIFNHTCEIFSTIYTKSNVQNGLIGSRAHHPILVLCVTKLKSATPGGAVTLSKTGPIFLARTVFEYILNKGNTDGIVLFPVTYFCPLPHSARLEKKEEINQWIRPETYAIHHWHCSWM